MPLNVQVSPQYQGVVEPAGSPQHTTVNDLNENFASVSAIPSGFVGTARVGTDLYVGDGVSNIKPVISAPTYALLAYDDFASYTGALAGHTPPMGVAWITAGVNPSNFTVTNGYAYNTNTSSGGASYAVFQSATAFKKVTHRYKGSHSVITLINNYSVNAFAEMIHIQITPSTIAASYWHGGLSNQGMPGAFLGSQPSPLYDVNIPHDFTLELCDSTIIVYIDNVAVYEIFVESSLASIKDNATGTFFETFGDTDGARLYGVYLYNKTEQIYPSIKTNYIRSGEANFFALQVGNPVQPLFFPASASYFFVDSATNSNNQHLFESSAGTTLTIKAKATGYSAYLNITSAIGLPFTITAGNDGASTIYSGNGTTQRLKFGFNGGLNVATLPRSSTGVPAGLVANDVWIDTSTSPFTLRIV